MAEYDFLKDFGACFVAPNPLKTLEVHAQLPDGREHWWLECIPDSYDGRSAVPLVLELHGGSRDPYTWIGETSWPLVAAMEGFLLVYPCSPTEMTWNPGNDEEYLRDLIFHVCEKYNVDKTRIYMNGMSMGDMETLAFSYKYPEMLAAVCNFNGPTPEAMQPGSPTGVLPVMQVRGEMDFMCPGVPLD